MERPGVELWCPACCRRRTFEVATPGRAGPRGRTSRMRCRVCSGAWRFRRGAGGRTVCEAWEPSPPLPGERAAEDARRS